MNPNLSPHPQKTPANESDDILAMVSLKSLVCQDVFLCDWLCINHYFKGTYCFEIRDQAVMETLSDLEVEYTMLLHNIGTVHPVTQSEPKRAESCCVLAWQICDTTLHHHLRYCVQERVQSGHFLLPVNICGVLSSFPTWTVSSTQKTVTEAPACPAWQ